MDAVVIRDTTSVELEAEWTEKKFILNIDCYSEFLAWKLAVDYVEASFKPRSIYSISVEKIAYIDAKFKVYISVTLTPKKN